MRNTRRLLQNLIRAAQLTDFAFELFQALAFVGGQARPLARIPLGSAHPATEHFDRTPDFLGDRPNRRPPGRMVLLMLKHKSNGAFTELR